MSMPTGEATAARAPENLSTSGSTICEETTTGSTAPPMSSGGAEKVAGNIFSLASGELLSRAIAFLATAYLARKLDPAGFGIIGFAAAFFTYFYFAGAIVFNDVGAREVARRPYDASSIAAGVILVRLAIAAVAMAALAAIAWSLHKPATVKLVVMLTGLSLVSLAFDTSWVYKGLERNRQAGLALVLGQVIYVAAIWLFVRGPTDILRVPVAQFVGEAGAALSLTIPLFRRGGAVWDWREGWKIFRASWSLAIARLLRTLLFPFNVVMIGILLGEREVGLYTAPYRICLLFLSLAVTLQVSYLPAVTRAAAHGAAQVAAMLNRSVYLAMVMVAPLVAGTAITASLMVERIFGASFQEGASPFRFLVVGIGFGFLYSAVRNVLLAYDRLKTELVIMAAAAGFNVGLIPLVIPRYGLTGAAAVTAFSELIVLALSLSAIYRLGVQLRWQAMWRPLVAASTMGVVLITLVGRGWPLIAQIVTGAVIYVAALALCKGLPDEVRQQMTSARTPVSESG